MNHQVSDGSSLVLTIGHSTRTLDEFVHLLQAHGVTEVVDVRTVPRSRRNPQFNQDTLPAELAGGGLKYLHMPGLGGLRHARRDSPNTGWRNASFQGFADYMLTPDFEDNLESLMLASRRERIALMCAEAVPWRCHRSLIADALAIRGVHVEHIMSDKRRQPHRITPWATVDDQRLTYPPEAGLTE